MPVQHPIPSGTRFHRLTVLSRAHNTKTDQRQYTCQCACGSVVVIRGYSLSQGRTKSCGCIHREQLSKASTTHGKSRTLTYNTWRGMIDRCTNVNHCRFHQYGGRGIKICEAWKTFEGFLQDMGERPDKNHSIERIDNSRGYEKSNCRWATASEQNKNKRHFQRLTLNGESLTVRQWSEKIGVSRGTIYQRIYSGWPIERVLTGRAKVREGGTG